MKFVALLSGGKDSCFNLVHCMRNGHILVAAASLKSPEGQEEIDSYMYQTVGQDAVEFVAQALGVPLYRKAICGSAIAKDLEYGDRNTNAKGVEGDETEDLYELLCEVKTRHPDICAVSVGAILSNYQRIRVEHVCNRLGLTSLCYLWQRNQDELLREMIDWGLNAIIIKVAGIGLTVQHLGISIQDMEKTLSSLNILYGSHICGEGGEYETLVLDCPLFKKRISLIEVEKVIHSAHGFATVAYLRIKRATLEDKSSTDCVACFPVLQPLLSHQFEVISTTIIPGHLLQVGGVCTAALDSYDDLDLSSKQSGRWVAVVNVQKDRRIVRIMSSRDEFREAFDRLLYELQKHGLTFANVAHVNVVLSSMDYFVTLNDVYKSYFGTSPPTRACISNELPSDIRLRFDCIAFIEKSSSERQALHVQSLSYWAPANIGPYSQAVTVDRHIFLSGQIGILPCNLTLPTPKALETEAALSFQHIYNIVNAIVSTDSSKLHPQVLICWITDCSIFERLQGIWKQLSWLQHALVMFLGAKALPKGAVIENQLTMYACNSQEEYDGEENSLLYELPTIKRGKIDFGHQLVRWHISKFSERGTFCAIIVFKGDWFDDVHIRLKTTNGISSEMDRTLFARLFATPGYLHRATLTAESFIGINTFPVSYVQVPFIRFCSEEQWSFAICLFG